MKKQANFPEFKHQAMKLFYICLAIILVYSAVIALAAAHISPFLAYELIQGGLAATVISLGGGLLLDLEIRRAESKN